MEHPRSSIWLFGRSLLPSTASAVACVIVGLGVVAGGVLLASLNYGTILPDLFGGTLATFYTNAIVQPLETFLNSATWSSAVIMLLWGLFGVAVYSAIEAIIHWYEDLREARNDVEFEGERVVARHPLEKSFITHSLWRLGVSIVSFLFAIAVWPVAQHTFRIMKQLVVATSPEVAVRQLLFSIAVWICVTHISIVLLRLYTLRTRLFGDSRVY